MHTGCVSEFNGDGQPVDKGGDLASDFPRQNISGLPDMFNSDGISLTDTVLNRRSFLGLGWEATTGGLAATALQNPSLKNISPEELVTLARLIEGTPPNTEASTAEAGTISEVIIETIDPNTGVKGANVIKVYNPRTLTVSEAYKTPHQINASTRPVTHRTRKTTSETPQADLSNSPFKLALPNLENHSFEPYERSKEFLREITGNPGLEVKFEFYNKNNGQWETKAFDELEMNEKEIIMKYGTMLQFYSEIIKDLKERTLRAGAKTDELELLDGLKEYVFRVDINASNAGVPYGSTHMDRDEEDKPQKLTVNISSLSDLFAEISHAVGNTSRGLFLSQNKELLLTPDNLRIVCLNMFAEALSILTQDYDSDFTIKNLSYNGLIGLALQRLVDQAQMHKVGGFALDRYQMTIEELAYLLASVIEKINPDIKKVREVMLFGATAVENDESRIANIKQYYTGVMGILRLASMFNSTTWGTNNSIIDKFIKTFSDNPEIFRALNEFYNALHDGNFIGDANTSAIQQLLDTNIVSACDTCEVGADKRNFKTCFTNTYCVKQVVGEDGIPKLALEQARLNKEKTTVYALTSPGVYTNITEFCTIVELEGLVFFILPLVVDLDDVRTPILDNKYTLVLASDSDLSENKTDYRGHPIKFSN